MSGTNQTKLPYALNSEGKLVSIRDVKNGLGCNCVCPGCKQKLVAKNNGKIKIPHFAHFSNFECTIALQSMLHYLAKEIFQEVKMFSFINPDGRKFTYNVTEVFLENKISDIIPDVILNCDGKLFLIEIFVSHAIDEQKKEKIKNLNISTIEYNLSKVARDIDKESLKKILFENPQIRWFYDADKNRIENKQKFLFENGERIKTVQGSFVCPFTPKRLRFVPYTRSLYIKRLKVTEKFCEDCIFYSAKNEQGEAFCGKKFCNSKDFDFATIVGKNIVMTNSQTQMYLNQFNLRANKVTI